MFAPPSSATSAISACSCRQLVVTEVTEAPDHRKTHQVHALEVLLTAWRCTGTEATEVPVVSLGHRLPAYASSPCAGSPGAPSYPPTHGLRPAALPPKAPISMVAVPPPMLNRHCRG